MRHTLLATLAVFAAFGTQPAGAGAQQRDVPHLSLDAFGTFGLAYSSEDRADYAWNPLQAVGPGHSETLSHTLDSRLAGQARLDATSKLSAIVQVMIETDSRGDYSPRLEWANARYAFSPGFSARAGRLAVPAFLTSDHRKVGFANPWIRPPVELYGLVPVFTLDGAELSYRLHAGNWSSTLGGTFGVSRAEIADGSDVTAENAWNVNATLQRGGFLARVATAGGQLDVEAFHPLFDAFRAFGPEGEAIADRFDVDDTSFRFASAGVSYDPGPWFGIAEAAWFDQHSVLGEKIAGHVTGGYRWRSLTPYVAYSRSALLSQSSHPGLTLSELPPEHRETAAGLNAALNSILRSPPVQQNLVLGSRWDFRTGMALKLQVDLIDVLGDSPGTFTNPQPGFETGGSTRLVSLALDFVF